MRYLKFAHCYCSILIRYVGDLSPLGFVISSNQNRNCKYVPYPTTVLRSLEPTKSQRAQHRETLDFIRSKVSRLLCGSTRLGSRAFTYTQTSLGGKRLIAPVAWRQKPNGLPRKTLTVYSIQYTIEFIRVC